MIEIRKGFEITAAILRAVFTSIFQYINEIDPTTVSLTTGQIIDLHERNSSDLLSIYKDQYFQTDIMFSQYAGVDVSIFQRYLDEIDEIIKGD